MTKFETFFNGSNYEHSQFVYTLSYDSRWWTGRSGRKPGLKVWWYNTVSRIVWPMWRVRRALEVEYGT